MLRTTPRVAFSAMVLLLSAARAPAAVVIPTLALSWTPKQVLIPRVMLGTGGGGGGYDAAAWLAIGGTGFDSSYTYCYNSAAPYCSHVAIYMAMAAAKADPASLFFISKIEPEDFGNVSTMSGFGRVIDRGILQDLSIAHLDVLMAHQAGRHETDNNVRPACFDASLANAAGTYSTCRVEMMRSFLALQKSGVARAVAVSNWQIRDLQQVFDATGVFPSALEVEVHPYWHEDSLIAFCKYNNITLVNYAPVSMANPLLFAEPAIMAAAAAHGVTPAQVVLRWGLQYTGGVIIPRSHNSSHMLDNVAVFDFALSDAEMAAMSNYPQKKIFSVYCQPWC